MPDDQALDHLNVTSPASDEQRNSTSTANNPNPVTPKPASSETPIPAPIIYHSKPAKKIVPAKSDATKKDDDSQFTLIKTDQTNTYRKVDPPLIDLKVTNPITYLKRWWKRVMANEGVSFSFRIKPLTAIALVLALTAAGGTGFSVAKIFFPNSSPILNREVVYQGTVQKTERGQYLLSLPDTSVYTLKPKATNVNLSKLINRKVLVQGNLTREPNLIEVNEITLFDTTIPQQ